MPKLHTITEVKTLLDGYAADDTSDNTTLELLQDLIYTRLEAATGRLFESSERVVTYKRPSHTYLPLVALPVASASVARVEYDSQGIATNTTLTANYHYYVEAHGVVLTDVGYKNNSDYAITYTGGYTVDSSDLLVLTGNDAMLKRAALLQLVHEFNTRTKPGVETMETAIGSVTSGGLVLIKEVMSMCQYLRHPSQKMVW